MFLTFEGMEGCGKSTQCKKLIEHFVRQGHDVLHTLEPGGSRLGKELRRILLDPKNSDLSSTSELFLYLADRAQHVASVIRPAMEDGRPVVTILLAVDPEVGLKRALTGNMRDNKAATEGRFEAESMGFHTRVREGYLTWAALHRSRFLVVDANRDAETVFASILRGLEEKGLG
jgi:dTMP kinase